MRPARRYVSSLLIGQHPLTARSLTAAFSSLRYFLSSVPAARPRFNILWQVDCLKVTSDLSPHSSRRVSGDTSCVPDIPHGRSFYLWPPSWLNITHLLLLLLPSSLFDVTGWLQRSQPVMEAVFPWRRFAKWVIFVNVLTKGICNMPVFSFNGNTLLCNSCTISSRNVFDVFNVLYLLGFFCWAKSLMH